MNKRRITLTLATAVIIVLIFVLYMITFVVREGEIAVVTSFEKVVAHTDTPGLYWKWPWPFQRVIKLDARLHTDVDRLEETKTRDQELVTVWVYYNWSISDPELFYRSFYQRDREETLKAAKKALHDLVRDKKDAVMGQYAFTDLLPRLWRTGGGAVESDEAPAPKFPQIERDILERVSTLAADKYGIKVVQVGITRLELPQASTITVFRRMREEREKDAREIEANGEAVAKRITADAQRDYDRIVAKAQADASEIEAAGEREAAKYYAVFAQNADLHDFLRKVQALRRIVDDGTTLLLSVDYEPFGLLRAIPKALLAPGEEPAQGPAEQPGEATGATAPGATAPGEEPKEPGASE
jgi:membrane protease subunit HflC